MVVVVVGRVVVRGAGLRSPAGARPWVSPATHRLHSTSVRPACLPGCPPLFERPQLGGRGVGQAGGGPAVGVLYPHTRTLVLPRDHLAATSTTVQHSASTNLEDEVLAGRHRQSGAPLPLQREVRQLVVGGGVQRVRLQSSQLSGQQVG